jgi:membrane protein
LNILRKSLRIALDAFWAFLADDGWGIASYIALSLLMALFPFLIVVTALAGFFFGSKELADEAARILLEAWPQQVATPLTFDIQGVMTSLQGGALTFGLVFALYFASSGVESLRIGLNRAYSVQEPRSWWLLRVESVLYVIVGAISILAFAFFVVLAPLIWAKLVSYIPGVRPFGDLITLARFATAALVIIIALLIVHMWLPAGKRTLSEIAPGIIVTLLLWLASGEIFGRYLAEFAYGYVTMYASLASVMIAIIFLYICASIFLYGAEVNSMIAAQSGKDPPRTIIRRKFPRRLRASEGRSSVR